MSVISEQVKELRELSDGLDTYDDMRGYSSLEIAVMLNNAADTIESLSAKLADMERSEDGCKEERYAIEQIIDAIAQADDEIICAIQYGDREGLEDVLKDYLH